MKNICKVVGAAALLVVLVLCIQAAALAAPGYATEVYVNNIKLDAATPYWQNGAAAAASAAPVGGWNAFFNAGTATLQLQDAVLNTVSTTTLTTGLHAYILANGTLTVEQEGTNTITATDPSLGTKESTAGIHASGNLIMKGSGSLNMSIVNTPAFFGVIADYQLTLSGGEIIITGSAAEFAGGFFSMETDVIVDGAKISFEASAPESIGVASRKGYVKLLSGYIKVLAESTGYEATGIETVFISLEGGTADVRAAGTGDTYGLVYGYGTVYAVNGEYLFYGTSSAIYRQTTGTAVTDPEAGMRILVSLKAGVQSLYVWPLQTSDPLAADSSQPNSYETVRFMRAAAEGVVVNNVTLSAAAPYWQNGSTSASASNPAGGYNAYFNSATHTLTLRNAVLNAPMIAAVLNDSLQFVHSLGDLIVNLEGTNTISYNGFGNPGVVSVFTFGDLTLSGTGTLDVDVTNTDDRTDNCAVFSAGLLTVSGGTFLIDINGGYSGVGMLSYQNILFTGGTATFNISSKEASAIDAMLSTFRMTGGTISANSNATERFSFSLRADTVILDDGEASFAATGNGTRYAGFIGSGNLQVNGGKFTFSGESAALYADVTSPVFQITNSVQTYASQLFDASSLISWQSSADGVLATDQTSNSLFQYVEFVLPQVAPPPIPPEPDPGTAPQEVYDSIPKTGDSQTPHLWIWLALLALCAGGCIYFVVRAARRASMFRKDK